MASITIQRIRLSSQWIKRCVQATHLYYLMSEPFNLSNNFRAGNHQCQGNSILEVIKIWVQENLYLKNFETKRNKKQFIFVSALSIKDITRMK